MNTEEYAERLQKRVAEIMFQNRDLFPIVDDIFISKDFYKVPDKDAEFYVRQTIESRIGLSYIIRHKVNSVEEIRYTFNYKTNIVDEIEKALIKSILLEYVKVFPDHGDSEKFNKIKI